MGKKSEVLEHHSFSSLFDFACVCDANVTSLTFDPDTYSKAVLGPLGSLHMTTSYYSPSINITEPSHKI